MKHLAVLFVLAVVVLAPALSMSSPHRAIGQNGADATVRALQTENAGLRTQIASLQGGEASPTAEASPAATDDELTPAERVYLESVASALDEFDDLRVRWQRVLDGPVQVQLDQWQRGVLSEVILWKLLPALVPVDAPSPRFEEFHEAFRSGLSQLGEAGSAYSDAVEAGDLNAFNAVTESYNDAITSVEDALGMLDDMGFADDLDIIRNPPPAPGTHTITGSITLFDSDANYFTSLCFGEGGYDDLTGGAQVVIRNESGMILATGELENGHPLTSTSCLFEFVVRDVPQAAFYTVSVGRRDGPTFSFADLEASGWTIELSIGD